jgi:hypothetical protein
MPKVADLSLSFLFILFFGYYGLLGYAFGSFSSEDPLPYALGLAGGIAAIAVSIYIRSVPGFVLTRGIGLLFLLPMVLFDLNHSFSPQTSDGQLIRFLLTYPPVLTNGAWFLVSILRLEKLQEDTRS